MEDKPTDDNQWTSAEQPENMGSIIGKTAKKYLEPIVLAIIMFVIASFIWPIPNNTSEQGAWITKFIICVAAFWLGSRVATKK